MAPRIFGNALIAGEAPTLEIYKAAFGAHLDAVAQQRQYDSRLTIFTWRNSSNAQYAAEAQAYEAWQDVVFAEMAAMQAAVATSTMQPPSISEFIAALTPISWP